MTAHTNFDPQTTLLDLIYSCISVLDLPLSPTPIIIYISWCFGSWFIFLIRLSCLARVFSSPVRIFTSAALILLSSLDISFFYEFPLHCFMIFSFLNVSWLCWCSAVRLPLCPSVRKSLDVWKCLQAAERVCVVQMDDERFEWELL